MYHLQKYRKPSDKRTCPKCGKKQCFKVYVDENDTPLDETSCGRCEHENSCGYHLPPKEWFKEHKHFTDVSKMAEGHTAREQITYTMLTLPKEVVSKSHSPENNLMAYFDEWVPFDPVRLLEAYHMYCVGSTKTRQVIWWQIDEEFKIRTGKMMLYDEHGHRKKDAEGNSIGFNWVHSIMEKQGKFNRERDHTELRQCLFGMHLLNLPGNEDKPVCIVESEKSAFIASIEQPQYLWMATGGMYNLNAQTLAPIIKQGRRIILHPDRDGYERTNKDGKTKTNWIDKAKDIIRETGYKQIEVSDFVLNHAKGEKDDIADIILYRLMFEGPPLNKVEKRLGLHEPNETLRNLIKTFKLEIV